MQQLFRQVIIWSPLVLGFGFCVLCSVFCVLPQASGPDISPTIRHSLISRLRLADRHLKMNFIPALQVSTDKVSIELYEHSMSTL